MRHFAIGVAIAALWTVGAAAQTPQPSENTSSEASLASGTAINAELNSSVDSKKAKAGEQITAHTTEAVKSTDGRAILPKGTKLIGHVTQATARSNGQSESMLAIQFDKAVLKDKQELPLRNAVIQALAAPASDASAYGNAPEPTPSGAPGAAPSNNPSMSGSRGARPEGTPSAQPYPGARANGAPGEQANAAGPLPANARGVYGFEGVRMGINSNGQGTVLTSSSKNVRLDGGTRLLLTVQPENASAGPSSR